MVQYSRKRISSAYSRTEGVKMQTYFSKTHTICILGVVTTGRRTYD